MIVVDWLNDPRAIYAESERLIREETDLSGFPDDAHGLVLRLVHAAADPGIIAGLIVSDGLITAARSALSAARPILVDSRMTEAGLIRRLIPDCPVVCTLDSPETRDRAESLGTTLSAAQIADWPACMEGAVIAIGNAPTALFQLLSVLASDAPRPAAILAFPTGFVGAADSKQALIDARLPVPYATLKGRRGGSAMAAAAVNALAAPRADLAGSMP